MLIAEITTDAHGEDEHQGAFHAAFEGLTLPADARVVGERVDLFQVDYDGNPMRGLVAVCKRKGKKYVVGLVDITVDNEVVAKHIAAYRRWLGIDDEREAKLTGRPQRLQAELRVDPNALVEAVLLKLGERSARVRLLDIHEEVTFRGKRAWAYVPGQILTIKPRKRWSHNGYPCMSGEIVETRINIPSLGLEPLEVEPNGSSWKPSNAEPYTGELADLWKRIAAKDLRDTYEIEWVTPGFDPDRDEMPAVDEANRLYLSGDRSECWDILADVLMKDLRCLEAHMLLGCWHQETLPRHAVLHFEVAAAILDHALGADFDGVITWDGNGNRAALATLRSYGSCLWQLGRVDEAKAVLERMLWLNPVDPIDARAALLDILAGREWIERTPTESD